MRKSYFKKFGVPMLVAAGVFVAAGISASSSHATPGYPAVKRAEVTPTTNATSFYQKAKNAIRLAHGLGDPTG